VTTGADLAASEDRHDPPGPRRNGSRRKRRRWVIAAAVLALLLLLPVLIGGVWLWYHTDPPGDPGRRVEVEIGDGWGVSQIADELASRDVIGSAVAFRLYVRVSGRGPFQAGTFTMREDMGSRPAAEVLERPAAQTYEKLALIPGLTLPMIADRVGQVPGLDRERFLQVAASNTVRSRFQPANVTSLEGLTWPDTYYVSQADTEETVLATLVAEFD
jgi:UPF0755 protein